MAAAPRAAEISPSESGGALSAPADAGEAPDRPRYLQLPLAPSGVDALRGATRPPWLMSTNLNYASSQEIASYTSWSLEVDALALMEEQRFEEAERALRRAIELNPSRAVLHNRLGTLLFQQGHYPEAEQAFAAALRQRPGEATVLGNLAGAMARQGKRLGAIALLREAAVKNPSNGLVRFNLACLLSDSGQVEEALTELERAVDLGAALAIRGSLDDPELDNVRNSPRYRAVVERIRRELR